MGFHKSDEYSIAVCVCAPNCTDLHRCALQREVTVSIDIFLDKTALRELLVEQKYGYINTDTYGHLPALIT